MADRPDRQSTGDARLTAAPAASAGSDDAPAGPDDASAGSPIGRFGLRIRPLPVPGRRATYDVSNAPNALATALSHGDAAPVAEPFELERRRRPSDDRAQVSAAAVSAGVRRRETTPAVVESGVSTPVAPAPTLPDATPVTRIDPVGPPGLRGIRDDSAQQRFEPPELVSFGPPTTGLVLGRTLIVIAALVVGFAARQPVGDPDVRDVFWPVVASAGVLGLVGLAAIAFWCVQFAENGRRLRARVSPPDVVGWTWAVPVLWAAFASLTFLRAEPGGDFDPYPAIAITGLAICLAIPTSRLLKVFRGMTRRPPSLFATVFALDLLAVSVVWWRLMMWSDAGAGVDEAQTTATLAFAAAGVLTASGLLYGWLALRAVQSTYERLGRIEARHRSAVDNGPGWFHSGFRPDAAPSVVEARPLINMAPLSSAVAIGHVVMGFLLLGWAVLTMRTAIETGGSIPLLGAVDLDAGDLDRLGVITVVVLVVAAVTIAIHGVWGFLAGLDAARVTVHAPRPIAFAGAFVPAPLLIVAGLVVGGTTGEMLIAVGLLISIAALVRLNLILITVASHVGRGVRGFGLWTWLLVVAYLVALLERFVVSPASGRLAALAVLSVVQGVLVIVGAVIGRRAMRSFEQALLDHPRVRRAVGERS